MRKRGDTATGGTGTGSHPGFRIEVDGMGGMLVRVILIGAVVAAIGLLRFGGFW